MRNEAEFLEQRSLDWFAGMITPVPELCCCVMPW